MLPAAGTCSGWLPAPEKQWPPALTLQDRLGVGEGLETRRLATNMQNTHGAPESALQTPSSFPMCLTRAPRNLDVHF